MATCNWRGVSIHSFCRDGWLAKINDVAVEAIETGAERITDEALERYRPLGEDEAAFQ